MNFYRFIYFSLDYLVSLMILYIGYMVTIDPSRWYNAREVVDLLDAEVTEATIKQYCKRGELPGAKKAGPRKRWMIRGASIIKLKRKWDLD